MRSTIGYVSFTAGAGLLLLALLVRIEPRDDKLLIAIRVGMAVVGALGLCIATWELAGARGEWRARREPAEVFRRRHDPEIVGRDKRSRELEARALEEIENTRD